MCAAACTIFGDYWTDCLQLWRCHLLFFQSCGMADSSWGCSAGPCGRHVRDSQNNAGKPSAIWVLRLKVFNSQGFEQIWLGRFEWPGSISGVKAVQLWGPFGLFSSAQAPHASASIIQCRVWIAPFPAESILWGAAMLLLKECKRPLGVATSTFAFKQRIAVSMFCWASDMDMALATGRITPLAMPEPLS